MTHLTPTIESISQRFLNADGVLILTGAGMGVDSGLPDFRGNSGIWTSDKTTFMRFSRAVAWLEHPLEAWNFYITRILDYASARPHAGYYELLNFLTQRNLDYYVITSNVDQHHRMAGYDPDRIYEVHGNLEYMQCSAHCCRDLLPMPRFTQLLEHLDTAPHCVRCGSVMRPNVLMFDDIDFEWRGVNAQYHKYQAWAESRSNLVGIEIGSGTVVPSIRDFGRRNTTMLVRINPQEYTITRVQDISIPESAVNGIRTFCSLFDEAHTDL